MKILLTVAIILFVAHISVAQTDKSFDKIQEILSADIQTANLLKASINKEIAVKNLMQNRQSDFLTAVDSIIVETNGIIVKSISIYAQDKSTCSKNTFFTLINPKDKSISINKTYQTEFSAKKPSAKFDGGGQTLSNIVANDHNNGYKLILRKTKV
ncbi:hypothetical protein ASE74_00875 [Pedobacter sp. Leaf216]|uniref:hypothetical protein n=1 Tax=Pedobacter sp. Leaf216 TaxID=1735684 RepID=UPI0006F3D7A7|nr:hypothetical protein [Pedobacter sp. Leaf216]KQM79155.1 hypothetical protein ASE74_00875 [Pedobacter sp. Leaf216]